MNGDIETLPANPDGLSPLRGVAHLVRRAFGNEDLTPLGDALIARLVTHPGDVNALLDLSTVLQLKFNTELALWTQGQALSRCQLYHLPAQGPVGLRLLALMAPGDLMTNAPLEFLLEGSDVALDLLYLAPNLPFPDEVPDHDLMFVAAGESDGAHWLLERVAGLVTSWPRPVLNWPDRIRQTSRENACARLSDAPGVAMPKSSRIDADALAAIGRGDRALTDVLADGDFPIIARPSNSHAGRGLSKLPDAVSILDYMAATPAPEYYVSRFIDYRGTDGRFRKYRVVLIDGQPYACHMGISDHWMIHYLNAGMSESASKRAEEAHWMETFDEVFAATHAVALRAIADRLALDYMIMDCAEAPDGRLLVFELDTGAIVHAMDPVDLFPYKQAPMARLFAAFRAMLARRVTDHSEAQGA